MYLDNNRVSSLEDSTFAGFEGDHLYVYLSENEITSIAARAFSFTR